MIKALDFSFWNYLVMAGKVVFGDGWSSALEYAIPIASDKILKNCDEKGLKDGALICSATADYIDRLAEIAGYKEAVLVAVSETTDAFRKASKAMEDGKITTAEIKCQIGEILEAVEAWKSVVKGN